MVQTMRNAASQAAIQYKNNPSQENAEVLIRHYIKWINAKVLYYKNAIDCYDKSTLVYDLRMELIHELLRSTKDYNPEEYEYITFVSYRFIKRVQTYIRKNCYVTSLSPKKFEEIRTRHIENDADPMREFYTELVQNLGHGQQIKVSKNGTEVKIGSHYRNRIDTDLFYLKIDVDQAKKEGLTDRQIVKKLGLKSVAKLKSLYEALDTVY